MFLSRATGPFCFCCTFLLRSFCVSRLCSAAEQLAEYLKVELTIAKHVLALFDTNKNGKLEYTELATMATMFCAASPEEKVKRACGQGETMFPAKEV